MKKCKECWHENDDRSKYCGNCGRNLEGEVQCKNCLEWVNQEFDFCPHCAERLEKNNHQDQKNRRIMQTNRNSKIKNITNTVVLVLCIVLALLPFGTVSKKQYYGVNIDRIEVTINIVDYMMAIPKGFGNYSVDDYREEEFDDNLTDEENVQNIDRLNTVKFTMTDQYDGTPERLVVYLKSALLIAMMVTPLILLGFTIYERKTGHKTNRYVNYLIISLLVSLILRRLFVGFVGPAVIIYNWLCVLGLLYSYIANQLSKRV